MQKHSLRNYHYIDYIGDLLRELLNWHKSRFLSFQIIIIQILFTGFEALLSVFVSSFLLGCLLAYLGNSFLADLGQNRLIYDLIKIGIIKEGGPLILAFIILLRSGTAITSEFGCMRVSREIDALYIMGISPMSYLVVPRVIGMIFSLIILNAYFIVVGLLGAYTTFWMLTQLPLNDFFIRLTQGLALSDVCVPLIKLILTGFLIGAICSYHGLKVGRAQTEIPQRIIMAVTQCTFALLLLHGIISLLTNNIEAT